MNSKQFHFNQRGIISVALAILLLALTVVPALAWTDEGGSDFQPVRSCPINPLYVGLSPNSCGVIRMRSSGQIVAEPAIVSPGVVRAEKLFIESWPLEESLVEASKR
jgi:hypothetical protein